MKRITRATLRGKPLDEDCKKYGRSNSGQFGVWDKRCFCTGIWNKMYEDFEQKCYMCSAWEQYEGLEKYPTSDSRKEK